MTVNKTQAKKVAKQALPCPFCGEFLVVKEDHHGFWVAHKDEPGDCFDSTAQLMNEDDLSGWNTRAGFENILADSGHDINEMRRIAAHVPAAVWIKAKEAAGFATVIKAH